MHKYFRWSGLFLFILALCVCGCSGSGSSADPMGTGTVQFVAESITSTGSSAGATVMTTANVQPSSSLTLTAWVSNFTSDGKLVPVINERVTFTLDSPENGARLAVLNDRTASNGQARVVYTAGNNLFPDVVRVTSSIGATASITITKTGTTTRGPVVALSASQNPAAPLGFSTITATVTDSGLAVQGERVTFALTTNNGASLSVQSGLTNASGQVITTYQAGNNQNEDLIQASLANGTAAQLTMTKTSAIRGLVIALEASPTSVAPLGFSTVTATVTDNGIASQGERVTFALPTDNGASLSVQSAITNASGQVIVTYQAGNNNKQDVVRASLSNGAAAQVIITKTGVGPGMSITLTSAPNPVPPDTSSIITATVIDSGSIPVSGVLVRFSLTTSNGTISRNDLHTDGNGVASIVYHAGGSDSTDILQATTDTGGFSQLIITKSGAAMSGYTITVSATPEVVSIAGSGSSIIMANVKNNLGTAVSGVTVSFTQTGGASVLPASTITDGSGNAVAVFTDGAGGGAAGTTAGVVTASITISGNTYTASVVITRE